MNTDLAPISPATASPISGWITGAGVGLVSGNVLRFTTGRPPIPLANPYTILQSVAAQDTDKFELQLRGNVNTHKS